MKNLILICVFILLVYSCKNERPTTSKKNTETSSEIFNIQNIQLKEGVRSFLALSDIHLNVDADSIVKHHHGYTDTDAKLWEYTKAKVNEVVSKKDQLKIDFLIFTGDIPFHSNDNDKREKNISIVLSYLSELAESSELPLLFVPGNNDGLAGDYQSFRNQADESPFAKDPENMDKWPFIGNKGVCKNNIPGSCYIDSSQVYGYYAAYPLPHKKLRFIGLNTVINNNIKYPSLCYNPPQNGARQAVAAKLQMKWFEEQMNEADDAGEKIMIAMHIPPGLDSYSGHPNWSDFEDASGTTINNAFIKSVIKHQDNIVAILTGHTHMDELQMIMDNSSLAELTISTPGITPGHNNNPGFKLYHYRTSDYELMDFTTFWSGFFPTATVQPFNNAYSFDEIYGDSGNQTLHERLQHLLAQDSLTFIQEALGKTYQVMNPHSLNDNEKKAMQMAVDSTATPITKSDCIKPQHKH